MGNEMKIQQREQENRKKLEKKSKIPENILYIVLWSTEKKPKHCDVSFFQMDFVKWCV